MTTIVREDCRLQQALKALRKANNHLVVSHGLEGNARESSVFQALTLASHAQRLLTEWLAVGEQEYSMDEELIWWEPSETGQAQTSLQETPLLAPPKAVQPKR
ncbi:hypothetical protein [Ferrimonas marina]|uniref:Uncharacterized protein n=1 Tax=Ferrimonas marina TaxID=299255 RepID=A0A1M5NFQ1_9GAMM|nr:hypothetical protein [Ferrimonas marina]SHG88426.1 hypothetical protein SAMN02745129_1038 [Ferrimonas marina]